MASSSLSSVKAVSRKKSKWGLSLSRFGRRRQLIISVLAVYFIVGGLIGYSLWNTNDESAQASETATITGSIRLTEDKEYAVGDNISLNITLQNTSVSEAINSVALDLFSTNSGVAWSSIVGGNIRSADLTLNNQKNSFKLPVLSSGERVEYIASGKIDKADTEYLTILGKIRFLNKNGLQESSTNRVFTKLKNSGAKVGRSLELSLGSDTINKGNSADFSLKWPEGTVNPKALTGKVYMSDRNSQNVVASFDCEINNNVCTGSFNNLSSGSYSLLFVDKSEEIYSNIASLTVQGNQAEFVPSGLSTLDFPFGSISINGTVPVLAKRVVSLNDSIKESDECTFRVQSSTGVNTDVKAQVRSDRSCYTQILTSELSAGEGIYKVSLLGTSQAQDVSFLNKSSNLIPFENQTVLPKTGQPVLVKSEGLVDALNVPLNNIPVILGIYQPLSATYKEYPTIDGQALKVENGVFNATIPSNLFSQGGFYNIYIRLENGQNSDFVGINFNDTEIGIVSTGVNIQNGNAVKAGTSTEFSVSNIANRSGSIVANGDCSAVLYATSLNSQGIELKGNLQDGVCKVVTQNNQLVQSGPALISFPEYSQSKQFNVFANGATSFGGLKLEYEPAHRNFANTLIIGPVTDSFGNLTNQFGVKIEVTRSSELVQTTQPVDIINGFAKIVLPSSLFSQDNLQIQAFAADGNLLMSQSFTVVEDDKLILPNIPKELNGDSKLKISMGGFEEEIANCNFEWVKSETEVASTSMPYDNANKKCNLDWDLTQYRNTKQALVKITAGTKTFNSIVNLTSGEAGNIFAMGASTRIGNNQELDYQILTSPILDKFGLPIKSGKLRLSYNGKISDVEITEGLSNLSLSANKLDTNDLRSVLGGQILELAIEAKSSPISVSRTNVISTFLGKYDISNIPENITLLDGSNILSEGSFETFSFKSNSCNVRQLSDRADTKILLTHWQGDVCYVEVGGAVGNYTIQLLDGNFILKEFTYLVTSNKDDVLWCNSDLGCTIQVLASTLGQPEAIVFDGDRQYKFQASTDNSITIKEPTLNPLKKYSVKVSFVNQNNQMVEYYHQISGEKMIK